jgi:putative proteasome-type protease
MSYCLAILTRAGIVFASDSRTNAGLDQVNVARKLFSFVTPGQRAFVLLASGGLSLSQSVIALLQSEYAAGGGLAAAPTMYDAARCVGEAVRRVAELDRAHLERDNIAFNVYVLAGGQVRGEEPALYLIYPQGNPLRASPDSPFLQIGEAKYGRPILDRAVRYDSTTLEEAAKLALISLDSTMRSNLTVGPPIDLVAYETGALAVTRQARLAADDPQLLAIRAQWEQELRAAARRLPSVRFPVADGGTSEGHAAGR